jgi:hypothetical protein
MLYAVLYAICMHICMLTISARLGSLTVPVELRLPLLAIDCVLVGAAVAVAVAAARVLSLMNTEPSSALSLRIICELCVFVCVIGVYT